MNTNQSLCIFVTGTDTDIGKTWVSAWLTHGFRAQNYRTYYWKPIQTGGIDIDKNAILSLHPEVFTYPSTFQYDEPRSPHHASRLASDGTLKLDNSAIDRLTSDLHKIRSQIAEATANEFSILVIEGAGGIYVPLNDLFQTWVDVLVRWRIPIVVVAGSHVGTINHTTLTLNALRTHNLDIAGVILNGPLDALNHESLQNLFPTLYFADCEQNAGTNVASVVASALIPVIRESQLASVRESETSQWLARDRQYIWHPYTQHAVAEEPLLVTDAQGCSIRASGYEEPLFDATGSWWVNTVGHGRREIRDCLMHQQLELDHVMFAGLTHKPAIKLASRLCDKSQFAKAFFSDNGSTAVEVAIKMVYQRWVQLGEPQRKKFLSLKGSYHGDTMGAMSVGSNGFHDAFKDLLFEVETISPVTRHASRFCENTLVARAQSLHSLTELLTTQTDHLAGIVIEPMIQGAGGMLMQDQLWLESICSAIQRHNLPVIFDEVFTGMGRLGTMFAFEQLNVRPDIVCLAKGLTGGTMPLAITLCREEIFAAFWNQDLRRALLHGHSFTANALACAVANVTLDIYESENLCQKARDIEQIYMQWLAQRAHELPIINPRCHGSVLAFEVKTSQNNDESKSVGNYFANIGQKIARAARKNGILLRPLGDTVYFAPPLVVNPAELKNVLEKTAQLLLSAEL